MIRSRDEMRFARAHLQREGALPRLRQKLLRIEPVADLAREAKALEAARREHDIVETALPALAQSRVDVAAQRFDRERGLECEQLRRATSRCSPDAHAWTDRVGTAQRVARILARQVRADSQALGVGRRHVLGRVHCDVDAVIEQRLLELLHEDAAGADLPEGACPVAVAGGRDRNERDLDPGRPKPRGRELGLGQCEPTAAAADADQHSALGAVRPVRRVMRPAASPARTQSAPAEAAAGRSAAAEVASALVLAETE